MRIEVTQEDIDRGVRDQPCACALALATTRATGRNAAVGTTSIFFDLESGISLPLLARNFVRDFDAGRSVRPFSFDLPIEPAGGEGQQ